MDTDKLTTTVILEKEQNEKLVQYARENERSKGFVVRKAVEKYLEENGTKTN